MLSPNGQAVKYERILRYGKFIELASENLLHNIRTIREYERTLRYGKFTELASKNLLHNVKQAEASLRPRPDIHGHFQRD